MNQAIILCLFEDDQVGRLEPLADTHAAWDILVGTGTLAQRLRAVFPNSEQIRLARPAVAPFYEGTDWSVTDRLEPGTYLFINGRVIDPWLLKQAVASTDDCLYRDGETVVAAQLTLKAAVTQPSWEWLERSFQDLPSEAVTVPHAAYVWDYIYVNPQQILADAEQSHLGSDQADVGPGVTFVYPERMTIGKGTQIAPGAVIDATEGPVIIGRGVTVGANAVLNGPLYVGDHSVVNPLTLLSESSIGLTSKVGGEVSHSIVHSYSNKQHYGYLGHSYIGSWCNLGGGTSTSNLKNTYGTISVTTSQGTVETEQLFLGLLMGDHAMAGTGTIFGPGTIVGAYSNVFGTGRLTPPVKPFTWWDLSQGPQIYALDKAIDVAKKMMARRDQVLSPAAEQATRELFARSQAQAG